MPDPTPWFHPTAYGPAVAALLTPPRVADLGPGNPNPLVRELLEKFDPAADLGRRVWEKEMARACHAGLWLYHDHLTESHAISQDLTSEEGSFWHAVMHRREPDAANSNYWWRRVGDHPILYRLAKVGPALGYRYTDPFEFVEFCGRVRGTGTAEEELARRVQDAEWKLLFDWCYRQAVGG